MFVLDDGWFGRRTDDTKGLGDYDVNKKKLHKGLEGIANFSNKKGHCIAPTGSAIQRPLFLADTKIRLLSFYSKPRKDIQIVVIFYILYI